jgi:cysteate synthase
MARNLLRCIRCSLTYADHRLSCDRCPNALLRAEYESPRFEPIEDCGIFRFRCWLPSESVIATTIGSSVYQSEGFAALLGLDKLFISFNGYWPERGAHNLTGTFKDLEALPTLAYVREKGVQEFVLSSAGNTARAFAYACSVTDFPCCIIVPEHMFHRMWLPREPAPCVRTLVIRDSCDYYAAIRLGERIRAKFKMMTEGGARNVARRDGMGTAVLEYARLTGEMPRHYVQAVGSGTGGIAAYEAGLRLRADGRFGERLPRLHLVQNAPFTPIHDAWREGREHDPEAEPMEEQLARVRAMYADVLANTHPPYGVIGGVRDALRETGGRTYDISRAEALLAKEFFETAEDITINEPAACACAGLTQAVARGEIRRGESVLLNITGGGYDRIARDFRLHRLERTRVIEDPNLDLDSLESYEDLFR